MSFDITIPCNCHKEGKINLPPFSNKLELINGVYELQSKYNWTELEKQYEQWEFCEHDQCALWMSISQGVIGWKKRLETTYPNQFKDLIHFFPDFNGYFHEDYDKAAALKELYELWVIEGDKHDYRMKQFERLLTTAIALDQVIYWD